MREIIKVPGRKNFPVIRSKQPKVFLLLNITLPIEIQLSDLELTSEVIKLVSSNNKGGTKVVLIDVYMGLVPWCWVLFCRFNWPPSFFYLLSVSCQSVLPKLYVSSEIIGGAVLAT